MFFWGHEADLTGKYKLTATHKETGETVKLYEWPIQIGRNEAGANAQSGGKFALSRSGLWRLEVYVNGRLFDRLVVDVQPAK